MDPKIIISERLPLNALIFVPRLNLVLNEEVEGLRLCHLLILILLLVCFILTTILSKVKNSETDEKLCRLVPTQFLLAS